MRANLALDDPCDVHILIDLIRTETGFTFLANMDGLLASWMFELFDSPYGPTSFRPNHIPYSIRTQ